VEPSRNGHTPIPHFRVPMWLSTDTSLGLTWTEKAMIAYLKMRTNAKKGYAWPSHKRMSNDLGISRSTVKSTLARLQQLRLLRIEHIYEGGRVRETHYFLSIPVELLTHGPQTNPCQGPQADPTKGRNPTHPKGRKPALNRTVNGTLNRTGAGDAQAVAAQGE
jgi:DNA-binding transcriptional MocR family regulator